jgi:hypothetical protein
MFSDECLLENTLWVLKYDLGISLEQPARGLMAGVRISERIFPFIITSKWFWNPPSLLFDIARISLSLSGDRASRNVELTTRLKYRRNLR